MILNIDLLLPVSANSMHFLTIYIIPLSYQIVAYITAVLVIIFILARSCLLSPSTILYIIIIYTGSCTANFDECCDRDCQIMDCFCDPVCYEPTHNDCCFDLPHICPRKQAYESTIQFY